MANGQTGPEPTKDITQLFNNVYPVGTIQDYHQEFNSYRKSSEEKLAQDRVREEEYNTIREAAEVHR